MMVVLLPASEAEPSLRPDAVSELARLGVNSLAVARDERLVALVVEGWAFEGWAFEQSRSARAVVAAFAGEGASVRTLHSIAEMTVSTAPPSGGER
jgi:hypothetical protein